MNRKSPSTINNRRGSSYLEVQVAMVLLSIGIGGLYSLSVIQTRQSVALERMLPADEIASINPVADANPSVAAWAQKLGAYADMIRQAGASVVGSVLNER